MKKIFQCFQRRLNLLAFSRKNDIVTFPLIICINVFAKNESKDLLSYNFCNVNFSKHWQFVTVYTRIFHTIYFSYIYWKILPKFTSPDKIFTTYDRKCLAIIDSALYRENNRISELVAISRTNVRLVTHQARQLQTQI